MIKDDDFKLLRGFADERTNEQTDGRTDICDCRVAFATVNFTEIYGDKYLLICNLDLPFLSL